jgi:hypothetical protein
MSVLLCSGFTTLRYVADSQQDAAKVQQLPVLDLHLTRNA